MLSVSEAIDQILVGAKRLDSEQVSLMELHGRTAAQDVYANLTQPPFDASAMDGYAVRFADAERGAVLRVVGEAPAGAPLTSAINQGEAARIFTGGVVPQGADHVVIQEHVAPLEGSRIAIEVAQDAPRNIRQSGVDFKKGDTLLRAGETFNAVHGSILAAANFPTATCTRQPKVCLFSNGNELKEPGADLKPGEIINSNAYALTALMRLWGATVYYLGCAPDDKGAITDFFNRSADADIVIPVGGASVGDHDYVKPAFLDAGGETIFSKVAVRPGKPTWFGHLKSGRVIGLPGNPASAIVTCTIFVKPLIEALLGRSPLASGDDLKRTSSSCQGLCVPLSVSIPANGARETYIRAQLKRDESGSLRVTPHPNQDSSLLSPFATCNALIKRAPEAAALSNGDEVEIVLIQPDILI
ncbi:MAG: gephyrin-like molybdotransferase Glp [Pseudomonadota bacterium]